MVSRVLIFLTIVLMVHNCQGRLNADLFREYYEKLMNEKRDDDPVMNPKTDDVNLQTARPDFYPKSPGTGKRGGVLDYHVPISDQEYPLDFSFTKNGVWSCYCKSTF